MNVYTRIINKRVKKSVCNKHITGKLTNTSQTIKDTTYYKVPVYTVFNYMYYINFDLYIKLTHLTLMYLSYVYVWYTYVLLLVYIYLFSNLGLIHTRPKLEKRYVHIFLPLF